MGTISNSSSLNATNSLHTIQYLDNTGKLEETVLLKRSPLSCDIVDYKRYDSFNRVISEWLPIPYESGNDGAYVDSGTQSDLSRDFYNDFDPLSDISYEPSFQGRITSTQEAGEEWTSNDRSVKKQYTSNKKDGGSFSCARFKVSYSNDTLLTIKREADYDAAELYVTVTTDEDNRVSHEFKNRLGQTLLIRQLSGNNKHDTYYIYDDFGNTAAVLPPAASESLSAEGSYNNNSATISKYAYLYCYDKRGYCIGKKLPATAWSYYIYDRAGRLILTQDGNMRKQGKWMFSIPDSHDRTVVTGIYSAQHNPFTTSLSATLVSAKWKGSAAPNSTFYGYQLQGINPSSPTVESVNYYDSYAFKSYNNLGTEYDFESLAGYDKQYADGQQGILTGSVTRTTSGSILYAVQYYDERGNMVQSKASNLLGGKEKNYFTYNFRKKVIKHRHVHTAGSKTIVEVYNYSYDHGERLIKTTYQPEINGSTLSQITLSEKEYDEVGRLIKDKLHGLASLSVDYAYNVRSWVTSIAATPFKQELYYNNGEGTPYYSGNISSMIWKGQDNVIRGYKFSYDALSRMTDAIYGEGNSINTNLNRFTEQVTSYDKNGNIEDLKRYGQTGANTFGLIDNLTMTLNGNQLKAVNDAATNSAYNNGFEFKNGANTTIEYTYDANGNLTKDLNKNIDMIQYNFLNLPSLVQFSDGSTISYIYNADGTKLRTVHKIGSTTTTTDYCGNVIYENNTPKLLLTEGGYVSLNDNKYHYYLKDHQGNNRVVIDTNGTVEETNHYYPFGGLFANSTNTQPYKYNG
ncbi:RHS repeat protein, partial [Bacteroides oleiciplenus]